MKEKIRLALIAKYKNLGFSNEAIDAVLAYLEQSVTAEDQIDGAVDGVGGLMAGFQKEVDRRANLYKSDAEKWQESQKPKPADPPTPAPANPPVDPNMPEWAKTFMTALSSKVDAVATEVGAIKGKETAGTRKSQLETALKDTPETYRNTILKAFDRMKFEKDDEFNAYLEEVKTDSAAFVQTEANQGLARNGKPFVPSGSNTKTASKEELDAVMSKIM